MKESMDIFSIAFALFLGFALCRCLSGNAASIPSGHWWKADYDATDDVANNKRSSIGLYIDYGTGCHYLALSPFAALTPRLDESGKQICEKK